MKKAKRKQKTKLHLKAYVIIAVFLVVFGAMATIAQKPNIGQIASQPSRNSLQLETFLPTLVPPKTATPVVTTRPVCPHDSGIPAVPAGVTYDGTKDCTCNAVVMECKDKKCARVFFSNGSSIPCQGNANPEDNYGDYWCGNPSFGTEHDGTYCVAKPVVYLYPEKDTFVDVQVVTAGKVVVSDPLYPSSGWQNVLAHPNGQLEYQGKTYSELFYESESTTLNTPSKGLIIKTSELQSKLKEYITILGLTKPEEQEEFLDWWVPRLTALNKPYIFFSILDSQEKLRLDQVNISPKPDTFIQFIAYFKPLDKMENIEQLEITPAPKRTGFTAIEWGGIVDNK